MRYKRRNPGGFSLAEAMIATVVLAIAAAGVLLPMTGGAAVRTEGMRRTLAAKLGSDLMEKVLCTDANEIVDWDGFSEAEGEVTDADGAVFSDPEYARFSRQVSCEDDMHVSQQIGESWQMFVAVTVRVYFAGREMAVVRRLVSK